MGRADLVATDPTRPARAGHAAGQGHDGRRRARRSGLYRAGRATTDIPVWRMIATTGGAGSRRGPRRWWRGSVPADRGRGRRLRSTVGGGSLPGETLPSLGLALSGPAPRHGCWPRSGAGRRSSSGTSWTTGSCSTCGPSIRHEDADAGRGRRAGPRRPGMTVVVGTAGHIDHGKTTLLRALTGIDADRLPEERRRGMTIDVGYAHLAFDDGTELDFVDVPGPRPAGRQHARRRGRDRRRAARRRGRRRVRAQTREHLALLDALGIDARDRRRHQDRCRRRRSRAPRSRARSGRSLAGHVARRRAGHPGVVGVTGVGSGEVRSALRGRPGPASTARPSGARRGPPTRAIDRVFTVKGRGVVVTGIAPRRPLAAGRRCGSVPGDGRRPDPRDPGPRTRAVETARRPDGANLAGVELDALHRGVVLTTDPAVVETSRILVRLARPLADRARARLHLGTAASMRPSGRSGRDALDLADGRGRRDPPPRRARSPRLRATGSSCAGPAAQTRSSAASSLDVDAAARRVAPPPDAATGRGARGRPGARRSRRRRASAPPGAPRPARGRTGGSGLAPDVAALAAEAAAEHRRARGDAVRATRRAAVDGRPSARRRASPRRSHHRRDRRVDRRAASRPGRWSGTATGSAPGGRRRGRRRTRPWWPRWTGWRPRSPSRRRRHSRRRRGPAGCPPDGVRALERSRPDRRPRAGPRLRDDRPTATSPRGRSRWRARRRSRRPRSATRPARAAST